MDGAGQAKVGNKQETQEEIEKRITDNDGNVKIIEKGQRYNIYTSNGELYYDKASASVANDYLEGFKYDAKTGMFRDPETGRSYKVKLVKKKK